MGAREMSDEEAEGIIWKARDSSSGFTRRTSKMKLLSSCVLEGMLGG